MFRRLFGLLFIVALLGGAFAAWRIYIMPGPLPETRNIVVPRGGAREVGAALQDAGVVRSAVSMQIAALITRAEGPLHAGEFAFPAHAPLREVLAVLRTAKPVQHRITVAEGVTAAQVAILLDKAEGLSGPSILPAEGEFLPDTYSYEYDTPRSVIVDHARAAMRKTLAAEWRARAPGLPLDTPEQALILASIVERETGKPDERPHVAAVFLNRLRAGMRLQSDPTVVYAASGGFGVLDRKLSRADLDRDGPYNTYRIPGLPPAPICMPGVAAIHAVLHPSASDDLYFVADGTGGHAFARTAEEHQRNVDRYRLILSGSNPARP